MVLVEVRGDCQDTSLFYPGSDMDSIPWELTHKRVAISISQKTFGWTEVGAEESGEPWISSSLRTHPSLYGEGLW